MKKIKFSGIIEQNKNINAAFVRFPFSTEELFGKKGHVKIKASIDGEPYQGNLANMGMNCHILGISQAIRKKTGKSFGNTVNVILEEDKEDRVIDVPNNLLKELNKNKQAEDFFNTLSYTNKKEYVNWITEAKKDETKQKRLLLSIEKLNQKRKTRLRNNNIMLYKFLTFCESQSMKYMFQITNILKNNL